MRQILHSMGMRFRIHRKDLPGTPDIVLPKHKLIINVNGCFWHGHSCQKRRIPNSNVVYWAAKILRNRRRDKRNTRLLRDNGWHVVTVWECWTKKESYLRDRLARIGKDFAAGI